MVNKKKLEKSKETKETISNYSVVGLVDMYKMPSKQLQEIRKALRGKATIKMTKKSTFEFSLKGTDDESLIKIGEHFPKQPAFILTDTSPFKLYSFVKNLKFKTFAKDGDEAKEDIWVYAGPTSLMAGPAISEFQQVGIPAGIESGKIAIKKDKLLVKKGESISGPQANILRKLKIEPIEITLNIVAIFENGILYGEDALNMVLKIPAMIPDAYNRALNLAVNINYATKDSIKYLLSKASMYAQSLNGLVKFETDKSEGGVENESTEPSETETPSAEKVDGSTEV